MCKGTQSVRQCPSFLNETPIERFQLTKNLNICINHSSKTYPSKNTCKFCQKHHHLLLSFMTDNALATVTVSPTSNIVSDAVPRSILLSTLLVNISYSRGPYFPSTLGQ
ncbi:unnamed protein product [Macrosiphum euphorbiae]|uniref:Uncharacterized protein n=1 Tax=Macrosiphum euphorbiae TaxID=13131 RepID=A0AAV0WRR2_9HEMI|nr:unnamed protein product [Macrosiphum euphorbiae]